MGTRKILKPEDWKPVEILHPEIIPLDALLQAIYQDIHILKDHDGVEFVENAGLILPVVNKYGDKLNVTDERGRSVSDITSHAYRSAAWEFEL